MDTATLPDLSALSRNGLAALLTKTQKDVKALADKGDDLTPAEEEQVDDMLGHCTAIKAAIEARPTKASELKGRIDEIDNFIKTPVRPGGITHPPATDEKLEGGDTKSRIDNGESEDDKYLEKGPFKSFGHYAWEIYHCRNERPGHERNGLLGQWTQRVGKIETDVKAMGDVKALATGLNELTDSEGASFIPMNYAQGIWSRSMEQENLFAKISAIPILGNSLTINAYADDSRVDGQRQGGVQGYWTAEAAQYNKSKPTTRTIALKLNKLTLLVYATEELLEDSPMALDAEVSRMAVDEFTFKCNDALTRGGGVGIPLGYLNAGCKITQAAVSAQGANTIIGTNIDAMWMRRANPMGGNYTWIANQAIEGQLAQLNYTVSGTNSIAANWVYIPAGGLRGNADYGSLKGKPLIFTEQAEDLGTEGDLTLIDWTQWAAIVKSSGIKQSVSMHLRFDYDEVAFKFSFRADARPRWEKTLTRFKGANSLSPIVTLSSTRT